MGQPADAHSETSTAPDARAALEGSRAAVARFRGKGEALSGGFPSPIHIDNGRPAPNARLQSILDIGAAAGALLGITGGGVFLMAGGGRAAQGTFAVGALCVAYLVVRGFLSSRRAAPWYAEAEVWPGAVVIANDALHEPGKWMLNGGMVVTFDPELADHPERLASLAGTLLEIYSNGDGGTTEQAELARWMIEHLEDPRYDRRRVPKPLAGNDETWLVSLGMDRAAMPAGYLDRQVFPMLLRREFNESAIMVPHRFWGGEIDD